MSRNRRRHARTVVGAVSAGMLAVAAVSGCGAGFSAETNHVTGSVNGQDVVANNILVRNAYVRGPANVGEQTEIYMFLINRGGDVDRLSQIKTNFATSVDIGGDATLTPGVPVSYQPDSPAKITARGLTTPLVLGAFEQATLVFDRAGSVSIDLPVQTLQQAQNQP